MLCGFMIFAISVLMDTQTFSDFDDDFLIFGREDLRSVYFLYLFGSDIVVALWSEEFAYGLVFVKSCKHLDSRLYLWLSVF